jgi:hypothetical protein
MLKFSKFLFLFFSLFLSFRFSFTEFKIFFPFPLFPIKIFFSQNFPFPFEDFFSVSVDSVLISGLILRNLYRLVYILVRF